MSATDLIAQPTFSRGGAPEGITYRFPKWRDAGWNSFDRQRERYLAVKPYLGTRSVGAELGVYKGGFGEFLLPHCSKLYLVDPWYRLLRKWPSGIEDDRSVDSVIEILRIYRDEITAGQLEVIIDYTLNFLAEIREAWFDFIYLDASHDYDQTRKELNAALPKMKPGGMLLGDDYDPDPASKQHGVYLAVNELVAENDLEFVFSKGRQWGVRAH